MMMTRLGEYFEKKSINKAGVARKTGISKQRLSQLSLNKTTKLTVEELYLISLALDVNPHEILDFVCQDMALPR